jgi:thymidylate synthase
LIRRSRVKLAPSAPSDSVYFAEDTLDDLLRLVFESILRLGRHVKPTKGWNRELSGVLLELRQPQARLSRTETKGTVFSALGETLWYLAKSNKLEQITYYLPSYRRFSDDLHTLYGAYGPRLFTMHGKFDQIQNVLVLLKRKPTTRQAVIQLFDAADITKERKDIPCTCTLQFLIREGRLHMITNMRSNDAYLGLPHDIFAFTFLQELLARSIGVRLGTYKHAVGSLHLYDSDRAKARQFLREGWQSTISMPSMPSGDPWPSVARLLSIEARIRQGEIVRLDSIRLPNYWADLARLLQIFANTKRNRAIVDIKNQMTTNVFDPYIEKREKMTRSGRGRLTQ